MLGNGEGHPAAERGDDHLGVPAVLGEGILQGGLDRLLVEPARPFQPLLGKVRVDHHDVFFGHDLGDLVNATDPTRDLTATNFQEYLLRIGPRAQEGVLTLLAVWTLVVYVGGLRAR